MVAVQEVEGLQAVVTKAHTWLSGLKKVLLKKQEWSCLEVCMRAVRVVMGR